MKKIALFYSTLFIFQLGCLAEPYEIRINTKLLSEKQQARNKEWRDLTKQIATAHPEAVVLNGKNDKKVVALTFDDGPDDSVTPQVLDELKRQGIKATFFFVGERVKLYKKIVLRAHKEGHLVLGHSWSHPLFSKLSSVQVQSEILRTEEFLDKLIGKRPRIFRPPYGDISAHIPLVKKLGYKAILWSLDTLDWLSATNQDQIVKTVDEHVRPGEIILMHASTNKRQSAQALSKIIKVIRDKKYSCVRVDELLGIKR